VGAYHPTARLLHVGWTLSALNSRLWKMICVGRAQSGACPVPANIEERRGTLRATLHFDWKPPTAEIEMYVTSRDYVVGLDGNPMGLREAPYDSFKMAIDNGFKSAAWK
jgi:hypothetical protein